MSNELKILDNLELIQYLWGTKEADLKQEDMSEEYIPTKPFYIYERPNNMIFVQLETYIKIEMPVYLAIELGVNKKIKGLVIEGTTSLDFISTDFLLRIEKALNKYRNEEEIEQDDKIVVVMYNSGNKVVKRHDFYTKNKSFIFSHRGRNDIYNTGSPQKQWEEMIKFE